MKHQALGIITCILLTLFTSCGDSQEGHGAKYQPPVDPDAEPIVKTTRTVRATEAAKNAALERVKVMQQITKVLKPLRDPETALAKEAELRALFDEYYRLTEVTRSEGIEGDLLAQWTAHLAPDEWRDTRAEFNQYMLLVKQLGEPQRKMMEQLMEPQATDQTASEDES